MPNASLPSSSVSHPGWLVQSQPEAQTDQGQPQSDYAAESCSDAPKSKRRRKLEREVSDPPSLISVGSSCGGLLDFVNIKNFDADNQVVPEVLCSDTQVADSQLDPSDAGPRQSQPLDSSQQHGGDQLMEMDSQFQEG